MSKGFTQTALDTAQAARNISNIIKSGMKGGMSGAAKETLKKYWPKILTVALILLFLPVIIFLSLPAILFGFDPKYPTAEEIARRKYEVQTAYTKFEDFRQEQIDRYVWQNESSYNTVTVVWENADAFTEEWLAAINSADIDNDIMKSSENEVKKLITNTYFIRREEIDIEPEQEEPEKPESKNPWEDTTYEGPSYIPETPKEETSSGTSHETYVRKQNLIIHVIVRPPEEVMKILTFDQDKHDWACNMHQALTEEDT